MIEWFEGEGERHTRFERPVGYFGQMAMSFPWPQRRDCKIG